MYTHMNVSQTMLIIHTFSIHVRKYKNIGPTFDETKTEERCVLKTT